MLQLIKSINIWYPISGVKTKMLCLSGDLVWAVTDNDHIVCRVGITADHIQGEHWKQIPTNTTISHITGMAMTMRLCQV